MSAFSAYLEQEIIGFLKGTTVDAAPTSLLLALSTADPLDDKSGIAEPVAMGYARQTIVLGTPASSNGVGTTVTGPTTDLVFGPATGAWGSITHWAIFENTGTNMLLHGAITAPKDIASGDSFVVNADALTVIVR